ncbi:MAG: VWA domain-containing protein [Chloroflexi bacterium]|nr:VWA domain-containing protein [Chloroflexota bacterium]
MSPSFRRPLVRLTSLTLLALTALALGRAPETRPAAAQGREEALIAYRMVDQWPERAEAAAGLFQSPFDLEVAADGTVLVADRGIGGVHRLLPTGAFTTPFGTAGGFPAQLGQVGQMGVGPAPDGSGDRVYVIDSAVDRLVVYDVAGGYVTHWDGITAQSVAASVDGRVYVLDREASAVRALSAVDGSEQFRFGSRGTEDGQFANFSDVDISEDGRVLAVADLNGLRVQLLDLATDAAIAGGAAPIALRTVHNLTESRYNKTDMVCRAPRVNALGGDRIFVGQGEQACLIEGREVSAAIASTANKGTVCRATVRLPRLRPNGAQFFALATYDPNAGACGDKLTELDTTTVIVRYNDEGLRGVRTVWEAAATDDVNGRLFAPQELTMPAADQIFVRDNSPELRFYGIDGSLLASIARDTSGRDQGTEAEVTRVQRAVGAEVLGEIYAQYVKIRRTDTSFDFEAGIGRFKAAEERTRTGPEAIIEPIWTKAYASGGRGGTSTEQISVLNMAWNYTRGELLVLQERVVPQQQLYGVQIVRYGPDGRELDPAWDLPHDGDFNPYGDMSVGPDGRVYLLDDINDLALVLGTDGQVVRQVAVAQDARGVAGGPADAAGSIFIMREQGAIERYADDGRITARLDGRALAFSDPTFLTDMLVDGAGRVYVADGQASLISVFASTDDIDVLPVPDDGDCDFVGRKTAAPGSVQLGDPVTIELSLLGSCGVSEDPTDIVIVMPYLQQLQGGRDRSRMTINNLLDLARRLNFDRHRVGIVAYYQTNSVELALTGDRDTYLDTILNLTRIDPPNQDIKPSLKKAMEKADTVFEPASGRRQVMVLLGAAYCDPNNQRRPVDCSGYELADDTAKAIRDAGTHIIVAFGGSAANLASSDEDVVNNFGDVHRRMVDYRLPEVLIQSLNLVDELPANMRLIAGSVEGGGSWAAPSLSWQRTQLRFEPLTLRFQVEPLAGGRWPTNVQAYAELTDGWGMQQRIDFPVPEVEVIAPTPEPSATPVGPTATPTAAPTETPEPSVPGTVYLPWLGRNLCWPKNAALDLVLVLDTSSSMQGDKLDAAKAAIGSFLDLARLEPGRDRAALVGFDATARTLQGLTEDRAALRAALAGVVSGEGTRIDRGLGEAIAVLDAGRRESGALPVVVLLSDGRQDEDVAAARAAGDAARQRGFEVYTIGLGQDVDAALLGELATSADRYLAAPSEAELEGIYAGIAGRLVGCP